MGRLQRTVQKETNAQGAMLVRGGWGVGCLHGNGPTVHNKNHLVGKTFHSVQ